jgi:hypothetical protein
MKERAPRPLVTHAAIDRDQLVEMFADERILRFAYAVEQNAKLRAATERLAKMNADYVAHALGQAIKECGADVERLVKESQTDGAAGAALVALLDRTEALSRKMHSLATD